MLRCWVADKQNALCIVFSLFFIIIIIIIFFFLKEFDPI